MIDEIENAIVARIKLASDNDVLGYKLLKVDSYGGELNEEIRHLVRRLPAVWVMFGGAEKVKNYSNFSRTKWLAKFNVICAAKSLRNEKSGRHGAVGNVGSYQIAQDCIQLLAGQVLGLDIDELDPVRVVALFNNRSDKDLASIYSVEFKTGLFLEHGEMADDLEDFETFHSNWDVPTHGNVSTDLPADDTADATDTITLET